MAQEAQAPWLMEVGGATQGAVKEETKFAEVAKAEPKASAGSQRSYDATEHKMSLRELRLALQTNLDDEEAKARLAGLTSEEAKAIADCRSAGIRTFMVTGDHALTAEAIAHKVGIITLPIRNDVAHERGVPLEEVDPDESDIQAVVITGHELKHLTEPQWQNLLDYKEIVFARTTPQQKLEIVEHLQARGEVVAVTREMG
ncbi:unnamed protein product [Polarella glacialis]|uniref:Uncharacterized protein n=1 Tax=Polarella glacialis TaxID=89957 RepID=A0A813J9H2_POLGL|nr:unnamed protein product [Polarella glacialis]